MKIQPNIPKIRNGLILKIEIGKFIRIKWVKAVAFKKEVPKENLNSATFTILGYFLSKLGEEMYIFSLKFWAREISDYEILDYAKLYLTERSKTVGGYNLLILPSTNQISISTDCHFWR